MAYPDSVEFLYSLGNEVKTIKFGLEGIQTLLRVLGNPQGSFRTVHIAGTNGKGSTCAMIESALRASGLRTGLYTSPHLVEPTERIRIGGLDVSHQDFARAFEAIHRVAERLVYAGEMEHHTTYFETITAMAFWLFRETAIDIAVLETGLGGRLDATNVVSPELCVITPIDFDHEAFLGSSLESIAAEKAGILKRGVPVVVSTQRPEAYGVIASRAAELGCPIVEAEKVDLHVLYMGPWWSELEIDGVAIRCPFPGEHQIQNAVTAFSALRTLGVEDVHIQAGIATAKWPGRLERVATSPDIVLDGAHNPAGGRALAAYINRFHQSPKPWIVYGSMRDKSVEEITEIIFPLAEKVILTAPTQPRAVRPEVLKSVWEPQLTVQVAEDVRSAVEQARSAPGSTTVFITGSLYLVGEARAMLVK